eukprot:749798-Hanusia_phi.AAC.4
MEAPTPLAGADCTRGARTNSESGGRSTRGAAEASGTHQLVLVPLPATTIYPFLILALLHCLKLGDSRLVCRRNLVSMINVSSRHARIDLNVV